MKKFEKFITPGGGGTARVVSRVLMPDRPFVSGPKVTKTAVGSQLSTGRNINQSISPF